MRDRIEEMKDKAEVLCLSLIFVLSILGITAQ